jgi:hypothetical protein
VIVESAELDPLVLSIAGGLIGGPGDEWEITYTSLAGLSFEALRTKLPQLTRLRLQRAGKTDDGLLERLKDGLDIAVRAYMERTDLVHSTWRVTTKANRPAQWPRWRLVRRGPLGYAADQRIRL